MLARRRRENFWGPDPEAGGGGSRGIYLMGQDLGEKKIINTPKAWKRSGDSGGAPKKCPSVVTATCYNGCVSVTTPVPTPQLGAGYTHSDPFPIPNHPMSSCSFDFRKFYRVGPEIMVHQPLH